MIFWSQAGVQPPQLCSVCKLLGYQPYRAFPYCYWGLEQMRGGYSTHTNTGVGVQCDLGVEGEDVILYYWWDGKVVQHCTRSGKGLDIQGTIEKANTVGRKGLGKS